ncbi:hypothetical protein [Mucilaginibacter lacusdianchii]|uniref:hypothetical protein n=1 Tax=Mucilaginibacter lacusdianchii TaxID=2684211 RepID=UPI00131C9A2B|nr:hypothetical protein [Mucilaginibacter sp. JXJ CY 39]
MIDSLALQNLLKRRTSNQWVQPISEQLVRDGFVLTDLLDLTLHSDDQLAFRAAWLLDTLITPNIGNYALHLPLLIAYSCKTQNHSCHRQYARILMYFTSNEAPDNVKQVVAETDMEPVVEQCFDWLIAPKVKVAVKAFAAEILFNLHRRYDWVAEELISQLQYLMKNGSPAIQAKGRRLLNMLQSSS